VKDLENPRVGRTSRSAGSKSKADLHPVPNQKPLLGRPAPDTQADYPESKARPNRTQSGRDGVCQAALTGRTRFAMIRPRVESVRRRRCLSFRGTNEASFALSGWKHGARHRAAKAGHR
jgi:hypothetical protein